MQVRAATLDDLGLVDLFQKKLVDFERKLDEDIREGEARYYPLTKIISVITSKDGLILIAEEEGSPVGIAMAEIEEEFGDWARETKKGNVGLFFVEEELRGKGVSDKLMAGLLNWLESRGIKRAQVFAYTNNQRALSFYNKHGFKEKTVTLVRG